MNDKTDKTADSGYIVTAPYITVRVKDDVGSDVIQGFYEGVPLPEGVNEDDLDRQIRKGMVAEKGSKEADLASPVGRPVSFDDYGNPLTPQQAEAAERDRVAARSARQSRSSDKAVDTKAVDTKASEPAKADAKTQQRQA